MKTRLLPLALRLLALGPVALLSGCSSETTTGAVLLPGEHLTFEVLGSKPWVSIESGDQPIDVVVREGGTESEIRQLQGLVARTYEGTTTFEVRNDGPKPTQVHFTVRRSDGVSMTK